MTNNFWTFRRNARRDLSDGAVAVDPTPNFEPIQLFTADEQVVGSIDAGGERMTDLLNARDSLRVLVGDDNWRSVARDEIFVVAPPPHAGVRQRKVHRQKRRVRALVGPYEVLGTAHLIPGIPLDPYLLRSRQHFLPMTNVLVTAPDDPSVKQDFDVVLLNVGNIQELHSLLTLA